MAPPSADSAGDPQVAVCRNNPVALWHYRGWGAADDRRQAAYAPLSDEDVCVMKNVTKEECAASSRRAVKNCPDSRSPNQLLRLEYMLVLAILNDDSKTINILTKGSDVSIPHNTGANNPSISPLRREEAYNKYNEIKRDIIKANIQSLEDWIVWKTGIRDRFISRQDMERRGFVDDPEWTLNCSEADEGEYTYTVDAGSSGRPRIIDCTKLRNSIIKADLLSLCNHNFPECWSALTCVSGNCEQEYAQCNDNTNCSTLACKLFHEDHPALRENDGIIDCTPYRDDAPHLRGLQLAEEEEGPTPYETQAHDDITYNIPCYRVASAEEWRRVAGNVGGGSMPATDADGGAPASYCDYTFARGYTSIASTKLISVKDACPIACAAHDSHEIKEREDLYEANHSGSDNICYQLRCGKNMQRDNCTIDGCCNRRPYCADPEEIHPYGCCADALDPDGGPDFPLPALTEGNGGLSAENKVNWKYPASPECLENPSGSGNLGAPPPPPPAGTDFASSVSLQAATYGACAEHGECKVYGHRPFCGRATYSEAKEKCESLNARLCTAEEMDDDCTANQGCYFDNELMWTSTIGKSEYPTRQETLCCGADQDQICDPTGSGLACAETEFINGIGCACERGCWRGTAGSVADANAICPLQCAGDDAFFTNGCTWRNSRGASPDASNPNWWRGYCDPTC
tara:strand:+ start:93 stop:2156 length:2064 start_codon:yes stop_codon:yes gene_type:complete